MRLRKLGILTVAALSLAIPTPSVADGDTDRHELDYEVWQWDDDYVWITGMGFVSTIHTAYTGHCPDNYELAGEHFTYDATDDRQTAAGDQCGRQYERGKWRTQHYRDDVTGESISLALLNGEWVGTKDWLNADSPEFGVQCTDNTLGIFVYTGGYVGALRNRVPVVYSIGDEAGIEQNWHELIRGSESSAGAWMASGLRAGLVKRLRANTTADFTIRVYGYDGAPVGTAKFDLTGIELQVEDVLQACGW